MGKVYRNVYFAGEPLSSGWGGETVRYYGGVFPNAGEIRGFRGSYDPALDLYVPCSECAARRYGRFERVSKPKE